jgi:hypothetical protein
VVNIKPLPLLIILAVLLFFYHDKRKLKEMHSTRVNELKDSIALYQQDIFKLDSILKHTIIINKKR